MKKLAQLAIALYENLENTNHNSAIQVRNFLQHFTDTVLIWEKDHSREAIIEVAWRHQGYGCSFAVY